MTMLPRRTDLLRVGLALLVLVVTVIGTRLYLDSSRASGDVILAGSAVEGLTILDASAFAMGPSTPYSNAIEDNWATIDLYLDSASSERFPETTKHIAASWTAYLVADQLWRLSDEGATAPRVSEVYAASRLLEGAPELRSLVIGSGPDAHFDNTELKTVEALFKYGRAERATAARLVDGLESEHGVR